MNSSLRLSQYSKKKKTVRENLGKRKISRDLSRSSNLVVPCELFLHCSMEEMDTRLYLCSHCCQRCLWHELSPQEHRCMRCRLPPQACTICKRKFEPRDNTEVYCKRCEFHTVKQVSFTPPPVLPLYLDGEMEPQPVKKPQGCTMTQRWRDIKTATGIEDGYFWND